VEVLPERVTILAEMAMHPNEIDLHRAEELLKTAEKTWSEAGDNQQQYDEANTLTRQAEEMIASAQGKSGE
jgi:F-type H+-transporting ATPase subunit epsilon